jgi:hypothetical protein
MAPIGWSFPRGMHAASLCAVEKGQRKCMASLEGEVESGWQWNALRCGAWKCSVIAHHRVNGSPAVVPPLRLSCKRVRNCCSTNSASILLLC